MPENDQPKAIVSCDHGISTVNPDYKESVLPCGCHYDEPIKGKTPRQVGDWIRGMYSDTKVPDA